VVALTEFIYNPWKEAAGGLQGGASQGGSLAVQDARSAEDKQVGGRGAASMCACLPACLPACGHTDAQCYSHGCTRLSMAASLPHQHRLHRPATRHPSPATRHHHSTAFLTTCATPAQVEALRAMLQGAFADRLLRLVPEAARHMTADSDRPQYQFPQLAGSHLSREELGSAALSFVRTLCHLLALDARVGDEVAVLRRKLLRLLHVGEFSKAAGFMEPCMAFKLPDVVCPFCNDCRWVGLGWGS
jgi:hypothetical protein